MYNIMILLISQYFSDYSILTKAITRLEEAVNAYDGKNDIVRDSIIQRFEFTYELTHKTLQELMKYEGVTLENSFPPTIFKKAYANGINLSHYFFVMQSPNSQSII